MFSYLFNYDVTRNCFVFVFNLVKYNNWIMTIVVSTQSFAARCGYSWMIYLQWTVIVFSFRRYSIIRKKSCMTLCAHVIMPSVFSFTVGNRVLEHAYADVFFDYAL